MDKDLKHAHDEPDSQAVPAPAEERVASRRRFTRNAVAGSAVLFSLGNRAAWGRSNQANEVCASAAFLASFVANGQQLSSLRPGQTVEAINAQEVLKPKYKQSREYRGEQVCVRPGEPVGPGDSLGPGGNTKPGLPGLPNDL